MFDYINGKYRYNSQTKTLEVFNNFFGFFGKLILSKNQNFFEIANSEAQFFHSFYNEEGTINKYFFIDLKMKRMFDDLIAIKTIGHKTAIKILEFFEFSDLMKIILTNDFEALKEVRSIGNLTARLVTSTLGEKYSETRISTKQQKVIDALSKLGYKAKDITFEIKKIDITKPLKEIIELTLKGLNTIYDKQ